MSGYGTVIGHNDDSHNQQTANEAGANMRITRCASDTSRRLEIDTQPVRARSAELLGPRGELIIEHAGQEYRLRRTRSGKLILTK